MQLKREVLTDYNNVNVLSYTGDLGLTGGIYTETSGRNSYHTDRTIAIGNGTGYQYPRGMFIGKKQVYPPIVACNLCEIGQFRIGSSDNVFKMSLGYGVSNINYLQDDDNVAYLFPGIFHVTVGYQNNSSYSSYNIPSFNPATNSNSTQWAYVRGNIVTIKDPKIPKMPIDDYVEYSTWPTNTVTHFEISVSNNAVAYKNAYGTTFYPLAYNKLSSPPYIIRRQFELGQNLTITTRKVISSSGFHFEFYKANNTKITSSNRMSMHVGEDNDMLCAFNPFKLYYDPEVGSNYNPSSITGTNYGEIKAKVTNVFILGGDKPRMDDFMISRNLKYFSHQHYKTNYTAPGDLPDDFIFNIFKMSADAALMGTQFTNFERNDSNNPIYKGNVGTFRMYSVKSSYRDGYGSSRFIPAIEFWSPYENNISYIDWDTFMNTSYLNEYDINDHLISVQNNILNASVTYSVTHDNPVTVSTLSAANAPTISYYYVGFNFIIPLLDKDAKFTFCTGSVVSNEPFYAKRVASTAATFITEVS